ncbi:hypothetical protein BDV93DRAFT_510833 [Ceratobasidium sp. AG-I]|nr:hypothetical protein BDV93DRAFT_510833 [Ceratobasidium sp. AG-I]
MPRRPRFTVDVATALSAEYFLYCVRPTLSTVAWPPQQYQPPDLEINQRLVEENTHSSCLVNVDKVRCSGLPKLQQSIPVPSATNASFSLVGQTFKLRIKDPAQRKRMIPLGGANSQMATSEGLVFIIPEGQVVMRVDNTTVLSSGQPRKRRAFVSFAGLVFRKPELNAELYPGVP